jgi:hypothetical protein
MYTVTLIELKAVSAQAKYSDSLNNTSSESTAQDDDFPEVKKRKRRNSDDTSQSAKNSTKTVQITADFKLPPKALSTRNLRASQNYWHGHGDCWSRKHYTEAGGSQKIR